ncbi:MAG: hypothetical protein V7661_06185 [Sulfitobacter sp.]
MRTTINKLTLVTTLSMFAFAGAATADDANVVSKIEVTAAYGAAESSNAREMYPEVATDIQLAIAKLVPTSDNADNPFILVDIRKIALNGNQTLQGENEFNQLEGVVSIENMQQGGKSFRVNIMAHTDADAVHAGYTGITPSLDNNYNAMVDGFAMEVAKKFNIASAEID